MEIKKLFEREDARTSETLQRQKVSAYQEQSTGSSTDVRSSEDRVTISPLSRQLSQISKIVEDDEAQRQKRVDEIKQQVDAGTYSVDSTAVARSMVSFAADSKDIS
jgi:negative regulator of flagellin synthesis FlgM